MENQLLFTLSCCENRENGASSEPERIAPSPPWRERRTLHVPNRSLLCRELRYFFPLGKRQVLHATSFPLPESCRREDRYFPAVAGAAGISAFPMSARIVEKMGIAENNQNHLLMHAVAANVSGQIASVIAGGMVINLVTKFL